MTAVLDGEASPDEEARARARAGGRPGARASATTAGGGCSTPWAGVPASHPPEGLVAAVMANIPTARRPAARPTSSQSRVFGVGSNRNPGARSRTTSVLRRAPDDGIPGGLHHERTDQRSWPTSARSGSAPASPPWRSWPSAAPCSTGRPRPTRRHDPAGEALHRAADHGGRPPAGRPSRPTAAAAPARRSPTLGAGRGRECSAASAGAAQLRAARRRRAAGAGRRGADARRRRAVATAGLDAGASAGATCRRGARRDAGQAAGRRAGQSRARRGSQGRRGADAGCAGRRKATRRKAARCSAARSRRPVARRGARPDAARCQAARRKAARAGAQARPRGARRSRPSAARRKARRGAGAGADAGRRRPAAGAAQGHAGARRRDAGASAAQARRSAAQAACQAADAAQGGARRHRPASRPTASSARNRPQRRDPTPTAGLVPAVCFWASRRLCFGASRDLGRATMRRLLWRVAVHGAAARLPRRRRRRGRQPARDVVRRDAGPAADLVRCRSDYLAPHAARTFTNSLAWQRSASRLDAVARRRRSCSRTSPTTATPPPTRRRATRSSSTSRRCRTRSRPIPASERMYSLMNHELVHVAHGRHRDRRGPRAGAASSAARCTPQRRASRRRCSTATSPCRASPRRAGTSRAAPCSWRRGWAAASAARRAATTRWCSARWCATSARFYDPLGLESRGIARRLPGRRQRLPLRHALHHLARVRATRPRRWSRGSGATRAAGATTPTSSSTCSACRSSDAWQRLDRVRARLPAPQPRARCASTRSRRTGASAPARSARSRACTTTRRRGDAVRRVPLPGHRRARRRARHARRQRAPARRHQARDALQGHLARLRPGDAARSSTPTTTTRCAT